MKYTLNVKETGSKAGRYFYWVTDENGKVYSNRQSNREYVACTVNGAYYFGRLDLINKGVYGQILKNFAGTELPERLQIAYIK